MLAVQLSSIRTHCIALHDRASSLTPRSEGGHLSKDSTLAAREQALWNNSAFDMDQLFNQKNESLTVEEMFVQGFRQENTRKTNIYSTAPIFMFFANYMR